MKNLHDILESIFDADFDIKDTSIYSKQLLKLLNSLVKWGFEKGSMNSKAEDAKLKKIIDKIKSNLTNFEPLTDQSIQNWDPEKDTIVLTQKWYPSGNKLDDPSWTIELFDGKKSVEINFSPFISTEKRPVEIQIDTFRVNLRDLQKYRSVKNFLKISATDPEMPVNATRKTKTEQLIIIPNQDVFKEIYRTVLADQI